MNTITINNRNKKIIGCVNVANPNNYNNVKTYNALIDTGSQETSINIRLVDDLKLEMTDKTVIISDFNNNQIKSNRYKISIQIDGLSSTYTLDIITMSKDIDMIIGMDILEKLEWNFKNDIFTINEYIRKR